MNPRESQVTLSDNTHSAARVRNLKRYIAALPMGRPGLLVRIEVAHWWVNASTQSLELFF